MAKTKSEQIDLDNIKLSDLLDLDALQKFQDHFAKSTNLASVTVDKNGKPVTNPSSYTEFCADFIHSTSCGDERCAECHSKGGEQAFKTGRPYIYTCHAGLIDFAAPIIIEGRLVGTMLGGQILEEPLNDEEIAKVAKEVGVDEQGLIDAAKKVKILNRKIIESSAEVLFIVSNALTKVGYEQYKLRNMSQNISENFSQISAAMQEMASSSVTITNNQQELNNKILNIEDLSKKIITILDSIKSIADQTKMLGLNAAIEAARAGDAGRGFGVVASEIQKLSQSSKETAAKIADITKSIGDLVNSTLSVSNSTLQNTEEQSASIEETSASIEELTLATEELNKIANNK